MALESQNSSLSSTKKEQMNKGTWTAEEDQKLAVVIEVHGAKKWKTIAAIAGLNRCGKSCRLRWLNYLRPNIKRGNISDQEEDLILRLHRLLGNRWSLIAGRLPGRTDNEIKNYWNSHLSKKINQNKKEKKQSNGASKRKCPREIEERRVVQNVQIEKEYGPKGSITTTTTTTDEEDSNTNFDVDDFFDFSDEGPLNLEWMGQFLELASS
ncbi:hypothetical protein UlMin_011987 [Ulmus minor]